MSRILFVKNKSGGPLPAEREDGSFNEPPMFDGQTYYFEADETRALSEPEATHLVWKNKGLEIAGEHGVPAPRPEPGFTMGTQGGLENFGAGHDKPGPKKGKQQS